MNDITQLRGAVRFSIKGQEARPAWERKLLANALDNGQGAPNDLRFQCRIAQDARENFAEIRVPGGTLSIHHKSKPQFGRARNGKPYLTVTLVDSRDGEAYKVRWIGDAVPRRMQEVAVKHDEGKRVGATLVRLLWQDAEITPVEHIARRDGAESTSAPRIRETQRRRFDRLCGTDLASA